MEPITILLLITATLAITVWPWILDFFCTRIIPWCREQVSAEIAEALADVLTFIDKGATAIRRPVRKLWKTFKETVLGSKRVYTRTDPSTVSSKTTTILRDEQGRMMQSVVTEEVQWEDLPDEIRSELVRQNKNSAQLDVKETVLKKFEEKARNEGAVLEMAV